ncbi:expressed unknown protein [Seminavis robusta]|uniref:Uncharacterized protein n=1 Tax=Seminavis robusta TaxID=568900 RepID=A0A9N8HDN1_9STRA|nr:expressed unknown protein [Seminavis robusta]|eukprot:Sro435_g142240.1 n/a (177) ;mRNA; r:9281-9811
MHSTSTRQRSPFGTVCVRRQSSGDSAKIHRAANRAISDTKGAIHNLMRFFSIFQGQPKYYFAPKVFAAIGRTFDEELTNDDQIKFVFDLIEARERVDIKKICLAKNGRIYCQIKVTPVLIAPDKATIRYMTFYATPGRNGMITDFELDNEVEIIRGKGKSTPVVKTTTAGTTSVSV